MPFKKLHLALVSLRGRQRTECPQVPTASGGGVDLPGIQPVSACAELPDHRVLPHSADIQLRANRRTFAESSECRRTLSVVERFDRRWDRVRIRL